MTVRDPRQQLRAAIRRIPAADRAVRQLRRTDEIAALNEHLHSLQSQLATLFSMQDRDAGAVSSSTGNFGLLNFRCNICGAPNVRSVVTLQREESSCDRCGSSLRCRGVIHALSTALFGRSVAIQDFPERPDIVGWGMTDWDGYASRLAEKLSYTNTFYHQEPHLDIMAISDTDNGQLDFLISSDVFEHVTPPVMTAFTNARRLLKPDGIFVLTVPYGLQPETIEHFPNLHEFTIVGKGDDRQLINVTVDGTRETFSDLIFHGGAGSTLEMRVFAQESLLANLRAAGFSRVAIRSDPSFEHGVFWWQDWSLPVVAQP